MVQNEQIVFIKYVSEWATDLRAISLFIGITNQGPPFGIHCVSTLIDQISVMIGYDCRDACSILFYNSLGSIHQLAANYC